MGKRITYGPCGADLLSVKMLDRFQPVDTAILSSTYARVFVVI
jgi:hypothetical protein